jgi:Uma2 family endonuclease
MNLAMVELVRPKATYQDVLDAPDNVIAEILAGELVLSPQPTVRHMRGLGRLFSTLEPAFDQALTGPGGWSILPEPEIHMHGDVVVPDIAGWRLDTLDDLDVAYFETRPDWACEILSPSTESFDRTVKLHIYAREGVQHVWLVNPLIRTLEILRLDARRWTLVETLSDEQPVRAEPFDAIEFELAKLWVTKRRPSP